MIAAVLKSPLRLPFLPCRFTLLPLLLPRRHLSLLFRRLARLIPIHRFLSLPLFCRSLWWLPRCVIYCYFSLVARMSSSASTGTFPVIVPGFACSFSMPRPHCDRLNSLAPKIDQCLKSLGAEMEVGKASRRHQQKDHQSSPHGQRIQGSTGSGLRLVCRDCTTVLPEDRYQRSRAERMGPLHGRCGESLSARRDL